METDVGCALSDEAMETLMLAAGYGYGPIDTAEGYFALSSPGGAYIVFGRSVRMSTVFACFMSDRGAL